MIIFIHGFASSGKASKAEILKQYFGEDFVRAPDLSHVPQYAIEQLVREASTSNGHLTFIGSSLGGYYAIYLMKKFKNSKSILINPAIRADRDLKMRVGKNVNYKTGEEFEFTDKFITQLEAMRTDVKDINQKNVLLLLQTGDDLLDYREALEMFSESQHLVIEGGSHEFENFDTVCPVIEKFMMS